MAYPKDWKEKIPLSTGTPPKQEEFETKKCRVCGIEFETAKNAEPICSGCWLKEHKEENHG